MGFFNWPADLARELIDGAKAYIDRGDREAPYEEVIRDVILRDPARIGFEYVTGIPWVEIDFPRMWPAQMTKFCRRSRPGYDELPLNRPIWTRY